MKIFEIENTSKIKEPKVNFRLMLMECYASMI